MMERILAYYQEHSPKMRAQFQPPAPQAQFDSYASAFGAPFPEALRPLLSVCNGKTGISSSTPATTRLVITTA